MCEAYLVELNEKKNVRSNLIAVKEFLKAPEHIMEFKNAAGYSPELMASFLEDEDPKVRKNAVIIMGLLGEEGFGKIIAEHYFTEQTFFVKSAYLTALKSYDFSQYETQLDERRKFLEQGNFEQSDLKHAAAELKVLQTMTEAEGISHIKHEFCNPDKPVKVIFTAPREIRGYLKKEIENAGGKGTQAVFCGVMTETADIKKLASIRIYKDLLFPLNNLKSVDKADIPAAVCNGELYEILEKLHKGAEYPFKFRLTAKDVDLSDIAARIQTLSGQKLINSVSDYEAELKLVTGKDRKYGIFLKLYTLSDKRFAYRKNTVATSMSTVNAAFTAYIAQNFMKENAQVIDPFCEVGTLLIERSKRVKTGHAYGTDIFGTAIEYARINTGKAGHNVNYINRNYFDFSSEYFFDEIITEMPKLERDEADGFYKRFWAKSDELLKDDGVIIMVSGEMGLVKKYIRLMKKYRLVLECPLGSKDDSCVYVIKKESHKSE